MKNRKWGDRRDGRWVKDLDGLHLIMPYIMPKRTEAEVYLQEQVDVTELVKYVEKRNAEGLDYKMTPFHLFITAIAKTVHFRPYLNRFIAGKRMYERDEISISFIVKRQFEDSAEEMLLILKTKDDDNVESVGRRIAGKSKKLRKESSAGINDIMGFFGKLPRWLLSFVFVIVRFLDFHGWMPRVITDDDTNFSTVLVSNLGSIKCDAPYHHLNNYGTNSIMITIGVIHKAPIVNENGEIEVRDVVNLGCTADERIADGFYFAKSIRFIKHLVAHPELLEEDISKEVDYEF